MNFLKKTLTLLGIGLLFGSIILSTPMFSQEVGTVKRATIPSLKLVEAKLEANPVSYSGNCPAVITFKGQITYRKAGVLKYKFIRSDGAMAPIQTLTFRKPGTKSVMTTWTLGGPSLPYYAGWEAIKVLSPVEVESNKAYFKVSCKEEGQEEKRGDLTIKIVQCPKSIVKPGEELKNGFQVTGTSTFPGPLNGVVVDFILTTNPTYPVPAPYAVYSPNYSNNVLILGGRENISFPGPGNVNVPLNGPNMIPADTPPGIYYLGAVIDAGNKFNETDEKNNVSFCRIKVVAVEEELKPVITGYRERCGVKSANITILGNNFGTQAGKGVALGGHGIHKDLTVISWSNTVIIARIPNDPQIIVGQWYYIGVEKDDCSAWLSNISKNITICK